MSHNITKLELSNVCQHELIVIQDPSLFSFLSSFFTGGTSWGKLPRGFSVSPQNTTDYRKTKIRETLIIIFAFLPLEAEIQCKIQEELNYKLHFIISIFKRITVSKKFVWILAGFESNQNEVIAAGKTTIFISFV